MYALNLSEDNRVLSATYEQFAPEGAVKVEALPEGDLSQYRYVNGKFVSDPVEPVEDAPTAVDKLEAQVTYTAMMTSTLIEDGDDCV